MDKIQTIECIKVMQDFVDGKEIDQLAYSYGSSWIPDSNPSWNWNNGLYRTKPKRKKVPLTIQDFDGMPVVWLRPMDTEMSYQVVLFFGDDSVLIPNNQHISLERLMKDGWQYSSDRKNWKDCWKYEERV